MHKEAWCKRRIHALGAPEVMFTNVGEVRRAFARTAKALTLKDGTWKALFDAYWQHHVKARIPVQAFDKMNWNFFRATICRRNVAAQKTVKLRALASHGVMCYNPSLPLR